MQKTSATILRQTDVTILVSSCDLYEDAWNPFIKLFNIQWPDCPYPMVINSETEDYKGDEENVTAVFPGNKKLTWSERLKYCLDRIDSKFVLFIIEDYFVQKPVNIDVFYHALELMKANENIGMACLSHGREDTRNGEYEDDFFFSRLIDEKNLIWCRVNLYRKSYLISLLKKHETIWEFESYAWSRAVSLPYMILQQKNNHPECFSFSIKVSEGYGITEKKWLPKNKELFEKYNISVNFDRLGFWFEKEEEKTEEKKSFIIEFLYKIKHTIKVMKRKINKAKRKYKSLH